MRVAICGLPGSGKTTAALTFPNPILVDLDHKATKGVRVIPFWDDDYLIKVAKVITPIPGKRLQRAIAIDNWLTRELPKFGPDQTVIIDSMTQMTRYWDNQIEDSPIYSKTGERDTRTEYRAMLSWGNRVITAITTAECRVVVVFHVIRDRNEKGELNGKYRPVATGQFGETILGSFTHALFSECREKPGKPAEYLWQVKGNNAFDSQGTYNDSSLIDGRYVPATFASIR